MAAGDLFHDEHADVVCPPIGLRQRFRALPSKMFSLHSSLSPSRPRKINGLSARVPVLFSSTVQVGPYTAGETIDFATALNLIPCFTPVRSPESNGVCEAFVKTFKRDYVRVNPRPDTISVLQRLPEWFEDYNTIHPHSGLQMRSPRGRLEKPLAATRSDLIR